MGSSFLLVANEGDHWNYPIDEVLESYGWDGRERGYTAWRKVHCPFHIDRTPSGAINRELNSYRCFSCDTGGNSVTLVMKHEGVGADEAVRRLSASVGGSAQSGSAPGRQAERKRHRLPWEPGWW